MNFLKFYAKLTIIKIRALLFLLIPVVPNREGWEDRVLLINLDFIGDLVMFTAVLKHYHAAMPSKKIFLMINSLSGMSPFLMDYCADEILMVSTDSFKSNPIYGYRFISNLRRIGFAKVIEHNPAMELMGRVIALELGAEEVICYEGLALDYNLPPSINAKFGTRYFNHVLSRKFTKIIPRIAERTSPLYLTHMIAHHTAIFESVTGTHLNVSADNLAPELPSNIPNDDAMRDILKENGIKPFSYALFALGSTSRRKEWPAKNFAELGKILTKKGIPIVITGSAKDVSKSRLFIESLGSGCLDLTGKTSISDAVSLVRFSLMAISNDTAITHFAVALKKPSLTIMYPTRPGWAGPYGYRYINRWVIREDVPCFGDNGQCGNLAGPDVLAPCLAVVTVEDAKKEFMLLLDHVLSGVPYLAVPFSLATNIS